MSPPSHPRPVCSRSTRACYGSFNWKEHNHRTVWGAVITLPETNGNIAPENGPTFKRNLVVFQLPPFSGDVLVSGRVCQNIHWAFEVLQIYYVQSCWLPAEKTCEHVPCQKRGPFQKEWKDGFQTLFFKGGTLSFSGEKIVFLSRPRRVFWTWMSRQNGRPFACWLFGSY